MASRAALTCLTAALLSLPACRRSPLHSLTLCGAVLSCSGPAALPKGAEQGGGCVNLFPGETVRNRGVSGKWPRFLQFHPVSGPRNGAFIVGCGCAEAGCSGTFALSPLVVSCFPATPKANWDVSTSSEVHPARWFDMRMLQLADTFIFQGGRSLAVHQFAAAVHKQHQRNGCTEELKFDWFKRQLSDAIHVRALLLHLGVVLELRLTSALHLNMCVVDLYLQEYGYLMCTIMKLLIWACRTCRRGRCTSALAALRPARFTAST